MTRRPVHFLPGTDGAQSTPPAPHPLADASVHRAGWVLADPGHVYQNGFVVVASGRIQSVGTGGAPCAGSVIDHGPGALVPALVNAHTHLELGALSGEVPGDGGFQQWVETLLQKRAALSEPEILSGVSAGVAELMETGCALVGDVSTLGLSWQCLAESPLAGVWFQEFLGNSIPAPLACRPPAGAIRGAFAGHAPHTTAPRLLVALKKATRARQLPMSIHVSESAAETRFITTAKGEWADFLTRRGIDYSSWGLPAPTPVSHLDRLGILDSKTVAVHLLHAGRAEFDILSQRGAQVCVCPRSNRNIHGGLPDLSGMLRAGLRPCIGTDSLASVSSLDVWDEMKCVAAHNPDIPPHEILAMATINGARALGFSERFGALKPGLLPAMAYVPVEAIHASTLLERMVWGEHD